METPRRPITILDKVDEIHSSVIAEIEKLKDDLKQDRLLQPNTIFERKFEAGEEIAGRYIVEEMVGSGKVSEMYRVRDKFNPIVGAKFALEVLHGNSEMNKKVYENEIKIRSQADNQHIGRFIFADRVSSHDFVLVLEYIDGDTMSDWMKIHSNQLRWSEFGEIIKQILLGLSYLHDNDFVHGDIQPKNIVIENKKNKIKIVSFGSSGMIGDIIHEHDGNKAYQPPDISVYGKHPGQDTYAVGLIMYEYIYGGKPFAIPAGKAFDEIKASLPEPLLAETKPFVRNIIMQACHPVLVKRFKTAQSMLKAMKDAKLIK